MELDKGSFKSASFLNTGVVIDEPDQSKGKAEVSRVFKLSRLMLWWGVFPFGENLVLSRVQWLSPVNLTFMRPRKEN